MPTTTIHKITLTPALDRRGERLAGRFDARIDHGKRLVHASVAPFRDSARALLERGLAQPNDVVTLRHVGSRHEVLRSAVGKAAKMAEAQPQGRAGRVNRPQSDARVSFLR
jgi:hypothetical protein